MARASAKTLLTQSLDTLDAVWPRDATQSRPYCVITKCAQVTCLPGARVAVARLPSTAPNTSSRASRLRVDISGALTSRANSLIDTAFFCEARCRKISRDSGHCSTGTQRLVRTLEDSVWDCIVLLSTTFPTFFSQQLILVQRTNLVPEPCLQKSISINAALALLRYTTAAIKIKAILSADSATRHQTNPGTLIAYDPARPTMVTDRHDPTAG